MTSPHTRDGAGDEYAFSGAAPAHNHSFLVPGVLSVLGPAQGRGLLDLGCGNGSLSNALATAGFTVVGMDSSRTGLDAAQSAFPAVDFIAHDLSEPLPHDHRSRYDVVVAAEVIEHLFLPRGLFERASQALAPGGTLVITTPFHGYWKNLALALTNSFDHHWRPSWDYGHIKFFSKKTLGAMATECGFQPVQWKMVGRAPQLAKSMILKAEQA